LSDNDAANKKFQKELISGTASLILLSILDRASEPMYGYQIAKLIETGKNEVPIKQGALYPVLRSLEGSGLLQSEVEPSVSGPPRKYYQITENGRQTLQHWTEIWGETRAFVDSILKGKKRAKGAFDE
jgi:PadR family transcriptional regulator PadR